MGAKDLNLMLSPEEFFHERVSAAIGNQKLDLDEHVEFYIVNLLCEFVKPEKLPTPSGELDILGTPLALILKNAYEAPPADQLKIFKVLGDTSLYITGFFQDFFNRKTFDVGYYINLGSSAYGSVSNLAREQHSDDSFSAMYNELAEKFVVLVDVVSEVSDSLVPNKDVDILSIYDRWITSNSDRLRKLLQQHGIDPVPNLKKRKH